jgi:hypothetical protein
MDDYLLVLLGRAGEGDCHDNNAMLHYHKIKAIK